MFIPHAHTEAPPAEMLARALRERQVKPWLDLWERRPGVDWQDAIHDAALQADGFVFLVGAGPSVDRKQELEWRSALRAQWQSDRPKAMVPVLIGSAGPPPFLRGRVALRVPTQPVNFDGLLDKIVHLIQHPAETVDESNRARASAERQERLEELKRFALLTTAGTTRRCSTTWPERSRISTEIEDIRVW